MQIPSIFKPILWSYDTSKIDPSKMQKTIVVSCERKVRHPMYKKTMRVNKKYKAHVGDATYNVGDMVTIEETRPMSKDTHFKVITKNTH